MSLEQDIQAWALTRPAWQQELLADLVEGKAFGEDDYTRLAGTLVGDKRRKRTTTRELVLVEPSVSRSPTRLTSIEILANVNRLMSQQKLTFSPSALTVIYGDNASGKSGYARVIKNLSRARHHEPILTDIFTDSGDATPGAVVTFEDADGARAASWPADRPTALALLHFYDRACGLDYLSTESEVTYRPSILVLFDRLIEICDAIRKCLDAEIATNSLSRRALPTVADPNLASFVEQLNPKNSDADVDAACDCPADADRLQASLLEEEAHLLDSDPEQEQQRLKSIAQRLDTVSRHIRSLDMGLGDKAETLLRTHVKDAKAARDLANAASRASFQSEPLSGTGSGTWQTLWDAAGRFSETAAYPGEDFPVVRGGAMCVLCQRTLDDETGARFVRFARLLADTTEQHAEQAERRLATTRATIDKLECLPPNISAALALLDRDEPRLSRASSLAIDEFSARKASLRSLVDEGGEVPAVPRLPDLDARAASLRQAAAAVDASQFQSRISDIRRRRVEVESRRTLKASKADIAFELARRRRREDLDSAKRQVDTAAITRKAAELARAHVTTVITDRFTRESDRLRLERITLKDSGGRKGQLRQRPAFLAPKQQAEMVSVLSEGEQTALGLAGFFTEAELDESRSALILDDPVSSLSHTRRAQVAARLALFARDRQVIVFTHDLEFAGELAAAADREGVILTEREISRSPMDEPGLCLDGHPWKAKSARGRLAQLRTDVQRIQRERTVLRPDEYEAHVADWAGRLSETWERIIKEEISDQLVDPAKLEVRPKMIKVVAQVTPQDSKTFEESYSRISRWARRHDKARSLNYVAPDIKELTAEIDLVEEWFNRIRKYKA